MKTMARARIAGLVSVAIMGAAPAPLAGIWSGDALQLKFLDDGAVVQSGCTIGRIVGPVVPDASGHFEGRGYFNPPVSALAMGTVARRDRAAVFNGEVHGRSLALTISVEGIKSPRRFQLKHGTGLNFPKCSMPG